AFPRHELIGCQRQAAHCFALRLDLLELDVLALEPPSHSQYSSEMSRAALQHGFHFAPRPIASVGRSARATLTTTTHRLFRRDPDTWSRDRTTQRRIANQLGWLSAPALMAESVPRLREFAARIKADGFTDVVPLGMGGSSLAPEVLRAV